MTTGASIIRQTPRKSTLTINQSSVTIKQTPTKSVLVSKGVPGPQGPPGPPGPPGGGGGGSGSYTHIQMAASALWTITHNLGYRPSVMVWDTAMDQIFGEVDHVDSNSLTVGFSTAISGTAYMS